MKNLSIMMTAVILIFAQTSLAQTQFTIVESAKSTASMDSNGKAPGVCDLAHLLVDDGIRTRSNDEGQSFCGGEPFKQVGTTIKNTIVQPVTSNVLECSVQGSAMFECLKKTEPNHSYTVSCSNGEFHAQGPIPCNFVCNGTLSNIVIKSDTYNSTNGYTSVYGTAICTQK